MKNLFPSNNVEATLFPKISCDVQKEKGTY